MLHHDVNGLLRLTLSTLTFETTRDSTLCLRLIAAAWFAVLLDSGVFRNRVELFIRCDATFSWVQAEESSGNRNGRNVKEYLRYLAYEYIKTFVRGQSSHTSSRSHKDPGRGKTRHREETEKAGNPSASIALSMFSAQRSRAFIVVARTTLPNITEKRETRAPRLPRKTSERSRGGRLWRV
ncbi:uncharacterized protein LOC143183379 [Calliopsis andreniformis]|uniref:uncharacterized protein LOC143183379 n=1 Tax=Calliopsis andreniformis TaxID=337506 RepID=UPI003FCE45AE